MRSAASPFRIACVGLAGLAAAMGIGRFAFTPLMPLMQEADGLTLSGGAWLATANYLGYLVGAVACALWPPAPATAARAGLAAVALTTLPMAVTDSFAAWLGLRLVCGAASACVLVGVSGWALARLAGLGKARWAGWVFAGVGAGIVLAGLTGLAAGVAGAGADVAWLGLGLVAAVVAVWAWPTLRASPAASSSAPRRGPGPAPFDRHAWLLVACYGIFGLGYIVPATFLPAMARTLVPDPAVFGWAWPVFGAAAAVSTVLASTVFGRVSPRLVAAGGLVPMAIGVAAPALQPGLPAVLVGAVCVGGTFMVVTMACVQLARELAADATRLVAAMTAAFALGQLAGPLLVGLGSDADRALAVLGIAAAVLLLFAAAALALPARRRPRTITHPPREERKAADA